MDKLKVVWICHFTNDNIQDKLGVRKRVSEFAPWITLGIKEAKKRYELELHIISPHSWIRGLKEFSDGNIYYHFFNSGIPFYGRHWPTFFKFDYYTNFYFNRQKIKKIVDRVKPDIINLHGVENPYYSSSIFDLKRYPIIITIQGLKTLSPSKNWSKYYKKDVKFEQRILKEFQNFGIRAKFLQKHISKLNSYASYYWFKYPFHSDVSSQITRKTIDCVFFARVSKDKGVEDLIEAIYIIKKNKPDISLKIIGGCDNKYRNHLKKLINDKGLEKNIEILGFLDNQDDVHSIVKSSKLTVLPTYNDILPGTIIESLKIGVPVISYAANGVVDFNSEDEIIKLVEIGNIGLLSAEIEKLINDPVRLKLMRLKGLKWVTDEANNEVEFSKLLNSYKKVIKDSKNRETRNNYI